jgi:hypothetical protein
MAGPASRLSRRCARRALREGSAGRLLDAGTRSPPCDAPRSTLQIFVASPGDVVEGRRLVIETIREFEGSFPWRNRDRPPAGMTRGDRTPLASSAGSALIDESPGGQ